MGRYGFRAGPNAENPDFTITYVGRGDSIRRLVVDDLGHVTETFESLGLNDPDEEQP